MAVIHPLPLRALSFWVGVHRCLHSFSILTCDESNCEVQCHSSFGCENAIIDASSSQTFRLSCPGNDSCTGVSIAASGNCCSAQHADGPVNNPCTRAITIIIVSDMKRKPKCSLASIDGQEFDFFPVSMCCYIIFAILLCIALILKQTTCHHHITHPLTNHFSSAHPRMSLQTILDYMIVYGTMILSIWESLFSFYRYLSTKSAIHSFHAASFPTVLSKFMLYIITFVCIFCIYVHLYYPIFPLLIILHCVSNIYCNLSFASILIQQYNRFLSQHVNETDMDILHSVYTMKRWSIFSNILSTFCLSIFLYQCSIQILYYLCALWSVFILTFTFNFVRNRRWFEHNVCCCINDEFARMDSISNIPNQGNAFNANHDTKPDQMKQNYERFDQMIETLHKEPYASEVPNTSLGLNASGTKSEHYKSTKRKAKSRTISAHNVLLSDPYAAADDDLIVLDSNHPRNTVCAGTNTHQHMSARSVMFVKSKSYDDVKAETATAQCTAITSDCVEESVNDCFVMIDEEDDANDEIMITPKNVSFGSNKLHLRRKSFSNPIGLKKVVVNEDANEDGFGRLSPVPSLNPHIKSKSKSTMLNAMSSFRKQMIGDRNRLMDHDLPRMDQMMVSLNVLAKSGFYSMKRISANNEQSVATMTKFKSDVNLTISSNGSNTNPMFSPTRSNPMF